MQFVFSVNQTNLIAGVIVANITRIMHNQFIMKTSALTTRRIKLVSGKTSCLCVLSKVGILSSSNCLGIPGNLTATRFDGCQLSVER